MRTSEYGPVQPGARVAPTPVDGRGRHTERLGAFFPVEPDEVAQTHDLCRERILLRQPIHGVPEKHDLLGALCRDVEGMTQRLETLSASPLLGRGGARSVDDDVLHGPRGDSEEVPPVLPSQVFPREQACIQLMDELGGLQRDPGSAGETLPREHPEFAVDLGGHAGAGIGVAVSGLLEEDRQIGAPCISGGAVQRWNRWKKTRNLEPVPVYPLRRAMSSRAAAVLPSATPFPNRRMKLHDPTTWPDRPLVMGIVNVTPDSFSDGGSFFRWEKAVEHGLRLVAEGADLLDIGGESTRPGAATVSVEEELRRVLPVVRALAGEVRVPLSIDTRKAEVAGPSLESGAVLVNDVGGLRDRKLLETAVRHGAAVCAMHMLGEPGTMQENPEYDDVLGEVTTFLSRRADTALAAGIEPAKIWLDPGIGFGKTLEHNLALLRGLDRIGALGYPVLVGVSRKRLVGEITGASVQERLPGSLAALEAVLDLPRAIVRVHDVTATRQFLAVRRALRHPAHDA